MKNLISLSVTKTLTLVILLTSIFSYAQEAQYQKGVKLLTKLKRVDAREVFTEIINSNPDFAPAYYQRAKINLHYKEYDKALHDFLKVTSIDGEFSQEAHLEIGTLKVAKGDYRGSITHFTHVIDKARENSDAYYLRGKSRYQIKEYEKALADFQKALDLNPGESKPYYDKGLCYLDQENYQEAITSFSKVIEGHPEYADAYFYRAYAYYEEGSSPEYKHHHKLFENALKDYNKTISLDPGIEEAYFDRAEVKMRLKDYIGAIADFKKAIELNPKDLDAHYLKAMCNYHYGYTDRALEEFDDIVNMDSTYTNAIYQIGVIELVERENYQDALDQFNRLIKIEKDHSDAFLYRGYTYLELGKMEEACADWNTAVELGDDEAKHDVAKYCEE